LLPAVFLVKWWTPRPQAPDCAQRSAKGWRPTPRLDVLVGIAFDRDGDRVEDDQANVLEALYRLRQLRHVGGRVEGPFPFAVAHAFDEMHVGSVPARRHKAR
jgi:hypothetical protein